MHLSGSLPKTCARAPFSDLLEEVICVLLFRELLMRHVHLAKPPTHFSSVWATSAGFTIAADEITQVRTSLFLHSHPSNLFLSHLTPPRPHEIVQICAAAANPTSIMGKNLQIAGFASDHLTFPCINVRQASSTWFSELMTPSCNSHSFCTHDQLARPLHAKTLSPSQCSLMRTVKPSLTPFCRYGRKGATGISSSSPPMFLLTVQHDPPF
jgi:hypothetical protein